MKDIKIKEARQALAIAKEQCKIKSCKQFCDEECEWVKTLDQFITDTENLINENIEINNDLCKIDAELEIYKKALDLICEGYQCTNVVYLKEAKLDIYGDLETYEKCMENYKPSYYDKLLKENEELKKAAMASSDISRMPWEATTPGTETIRRQAIISPLRASIVSASRSKPTFTTCG